MDWVKLATGYYLDAALMRAGEAAEILWVRGKAYAGKEENGGLVPREALPYLTPTRGAARANALVREGLWERVEGGWRYVAWDQVSPAQLEADRAAGRERQARWREKNRTSVTGPVRNAVTHGVVTEREVEVEEEVDAAAAAAGVTPRSATDLPVGVEILRNRLQSVTALASLRFDQLTSAQLAELDDLATTHSDDRLVEVALRTLRTPAPTSVAAFLGTWRALPPPGKALHAVPVRCPIHDTQHRGGTCPGCAADQKAGDR